MVEHSVVVNEEVKEEDENDYMAALESMKLDHGVFARQLPATVSGEASIIQNEVGLPEAFAEAGFRTNNFMQFTEEENKIIEQSLILMRNKIRTGKLLSHQVDFVQTNQEAIEDIIAEPESEVSNNTQRQVNLFTAEDKSENILSSGMTNVRLCHNSIGGQHDTNASSTSGLVMSSKPSHKNNNLSKKEIYSLQPKQANSLIQGEYELDLNKKSPAGILKPSKNNTRDSSLEGSSEQPVAAPRQNLRQLQISGPKRQEYRVNQSVTYSPVSHCVTRDRANIFEKKKQRMEKIQMLRGTSNQSEADKFKHQRDKETNEPAQEIAKPSNQKIEQLRPQNSKVPTSLPETPRDQFITNLL